MERRILRFGLALILGAAFLPGCESLEHRRTKSPEDAKADSDEEQASRQFFKSSRVSGAMSSEGREIERSLGIQ